MPRLWLLIVFAAFPLAASGQSQLGTTQLPTPAPPPAEKPAPVAPAKHPAKPPPPELAKSVPVVHPPSAAKAPRPAHPPARPAPAATPAPPAPDAAAPADPAPAEPSKGSVTGLPLPRFAALRTDEVNLRAGPGTRYQIEWVYRRRELPVEIEREFEVWRLVIDMDGVKGWVHQATLVGRRTFIVNQGSDQTLRSSAADTAAAVAILKAGVVGRILSCAAGAGWCEVQAGDYRGYLRREAFWGTFPNEAVNN